MITEAGSLEKAIQLAKVMDHLGERFRSTNKFVSAAVKIARRENMIIQKKKMKEERLKEEAMLQDEDYEVDMDGRRLQIIDCEYGGKDIPGGDDDAGLKIETLSIASTFLSQDNQLEFDSLNDLLKMGQLSEIQSETKFPAITNHDRQSDKESPNQVSGDNEESVSFPRVASPLQNHRQHESDRKRANGRSTRGSMAHMMDMHVQRQKEASARNMLALNNMEIESIKNNNPYRMARMAREREREKVQNIVAEGKGEKSQEKEEKERGSEIEQKSAVVATVANMKNRELGYNEVNNFIEQLRMASDFIFTKEAEVKYTKRLIKRVLKGE